jgi:alkylhydroperoxidase family enzyme
MDQPFEWAAHEAHALQEGVPAATIEIIRRRGPLDGVEATDAVVIALVRQALAAHRVDAALFARARNLFGERTLVELTMLIGSYASIAVLLTTFDVQLPAGQPDTLPPR